MSSSLVTVAYIGATILFILSLGGLSNPETSRRGNLYGIVGMTIAVLATIFGPRVMAAGIPYIVGAMVVGGAIGLYAAGGYAVIQTRRRYYQPGDVDALVMRRHLTTNEQEVGA